jgi:ferredoxin
MCKYCIEHGEGKKWYLNAKNYSNEVLAKHRHVVEDVVEKVDGIAPLTLGQELNRYRKIPILRKLTPQISQRKLVKWHFGQVLPIEDLVEISSFIESVVRFSCACRSILWGKRDERYCYGIGLGIFPDEILGGYPDVTEDLGLEKLGKVEALKALRTYEEQGMVHSIWTFGMPFTGVICNCTAQDCITLRATVSYGARMLMKGEYVAQADIEKCTGCKECMKQCNFGAITYSPTLGRIRINPQQCWGCGICRYVCSPHAIILKDRNAIPGLKGNWF